ncbi:DNA-binding transcriptional repressor RacR [Morganella morganii]|uniref:DNA-binding transcriptional repressor RacR n=1 Tax=Morganella morganii TaxID=582 RepID=UPI000467EF38|nr:helix-turn-helix domain-containing protein [Morganella morganii]
MLSGRELGKAIELAINKKLSSGAIKTKAEIARHFKIKPPSIYDWIKKGSISKEKLPELWRYFSDVVGPEHWGLREYPDHNLTQKGGCQNTQRTDIKKNSDYNLITDERRAVIDFLLSADSHTPPWVDSDVRAYVSAMDEKARQWLCRNTPSGKNNKPKKTGT